MIGRLRHESGDQAVVLAVMSSSSTTPTRVGPIWAPRAHMQPRETRVIHRNAPARHSLPLAREGRERGAPHPRQSGERRKGAEAAPRHCPPPPDNPPPLHATHQAPSPPPK